MVNFVHYRRFFYLLSAILIVPGVISLLLPGGLNPGIDFTSGTLMTVQFSKPIQQQQLRDEMTALGHPEAVIQGSGNNTYIIRTKPLTEAHQAAGGKTVPSERQTIQQGLTQKFGSVSVLSLSQVSPLVAEQIVRYAVIAVAAASVFILLYLAFAFSKVTHPWRYGVTAIVALVHDALVVLGIFSILGRIFSGLELESTFIVAVLTVIGFSVHDTIVVFDRIRENYARRQGQPFSLVVNHSLSQTLTRSLNTSLTVLLTLVVLMLFGGETIRTFVLALLIGITTGTYSSIFVASMLLVSWQRGELDWLFFWNRFRRGRALTPASP